jgi:hypothetical protein
MWTCTWTSFTSRNLWGWFHTFTSLPLVYTSNPDFLRWRLWLGFPWTFEASFTKITTHRDSRTKASLDSRNSRVLDLLNFTRFQLSWNRQQACELKPIRQSFRGILEGQEFVWNLSGQLSWTSSCHEIEFSISRHIHEHFHEFSNSDVSKVKGFCPIPQHSEFIVIFCNHNFVKTCML